MSSGQRTELIIAPYLTHHVSHHGQLTLIPPENAGRIRKPREKKSKSRPRPERNEDELRFNTGAPRSLRSQAVPRTRRTGQTAQGRELRGRDAGFGEEITISIPDYPPPSFQEAISSPLSTVPSTASTDTLTPRKAQPTTSSSTPNLHPSRISTILPQASSSMTHLHPSPALSSRASSLSPSPPSPQSLMVNMSRNSDSSSEGSSLEIVDLEPFQTEWEEDRRLGLSLEERVKREWERRSRAIEAVLQGQENPGGDVQPIVEARGRSTNGRALLDSDEDEGTPEIAATSSRKAPPKKRNHLPSLRSLSPLSRSRTAQERPASPLSPSSVYSSHRSPAAFLRSTTSLGRFPSSPAKGEHISRRLFSLKGKDKAVESEPLEEWEVIGDENAEEESSPTINAVLNKGKKRTGVPRPPLLSMAGPNLNSPPHTLSSPDLNTSITPSTLYSPTSSHTTPASPTTPTQMSMRDRPVPSPPVAFLNRQVRRPAPPPPSGLSICIGCATSIGTSTSPVTSPTRRKPPPPPPPKSRKNPEPLTVSGAPTPSATVPPATADLNRIFHRALEVPLPLTPLEPMTPHTTSEYNFGTPTTPSIGSPPRWSSLSGHPRDSSQTIVQPERRLDHRYADVDDYHRSTVSDARSISPTGVSRSTEFSTALAGRLSPIEGRVFGPFGEDGLRQDPCGGFPPSSDHSEITVGSQAFPNAATRPTLILETGVSRGRQISNAPSCSPRSNVSEDPFVPLTPRALSPSSLRTSTACPLSRARLPPIRTTSPLSDRGPLVPHHYPGRPLPRPPGPVSPLFLSYGLRHDPITPLAQTRNVPEGLLIDFESDCLESAVTSESEHGDHFGVSEMSEARSQTPPPVQVPVPATSITSPEQPLPPAFSQYTDLDFLLSRLEDEDRTGANYETLLMVSEVVGPATPTQCSDTDRPLSPLPLRGRIEIDRRRVMKDGRKKLKLSLLGVPVERCGICLSQFKEGEWGMLGECQHAFHEKCLGTWLAQSRTCPTCRASLDGHGL